MEETRTDVVELLTKDGDVEVYDLNPISEDTENGGSNGVVYAVIGAGLAAAIGGAIVGGKKLKDRLHSKKLEKSMKILEDAGYEVTKYEASDLEKVEGEVADVSESPVDEKPKKKN